MDVDPRREVVARPELRAAMTEAGSWAETTEHGRVGYGVASAVVDAILSSDAVLAALPEYEQVGSRWHDGKQVATYIVREPSTPKVCPTCGSDDPEEPGVVSAHDPACWGNCERHGCPVPTFCPDPFHSQGEPCDLCGGTGCWLACDDEWCDTLSHVEPCPRGCNPGEPEGATP